MKIYIYVFTDKFGALNIDYIFNLINEYKYIPLIHLSADKHIIFFIKRIIEIWIKKVNLFRTLIYINL